MKILLTGATGLIGNRLVARFLEKNHVVSIITRNKNKIKNDWKNEVHLIESNPSILGKWTAEINDQDVIVNLAGENIFSKRWSSKQKQKLVNSRVFSTRNIVSAINQSPKPPKIVINASGVDYYPPHQNKLFNETDIPDNSFLSKLCQDWENELQNIIIEDMRIIIFRFGVVFSNTGKGAEQMFKPHKMFLGGTLGSGNQWLSWIHIQDLVNLIMWSIENNQIKGVYNAVAPEPMRMKHILKIGGKIMNRPTWTRLPGIIVKIALGERAKILIEGRKISAEKVINSGYQFSYPTVKKALENILS